MLRALVPVALCLLVWVALPAEAGDDDAQEIKTLRARVSKLETQNRLLTQTLDLAQRQAAQLDEARRLAMELLDSSKELTDALQERARLLEQTHERQRADDAVRMEYLRVQLHNAAKEMQDVRETTIAYYGDLFTQLGTPAARVLAARLQTEPTAHAERIAPLLAHMGAAAAPVLPILERILEGLGPREEAATNHLGRAIASIRKAQKAAK